MRGVPPKRRPVLAPWSRSDCPECANPIEYVTLDLEANARVAIERRVVDSRPIPGGKYVAARVIGVKLHGYRIDRLHPIASPGYELFRAHGDVCPEATPPHEQDLFTT